MPICNQTVKNKSGGTLPRSKDSDGHSEEISSKTEIRHQMRAMLSLFGKDSVQKRHADRLAATVLLKSSLYRAAKTILAFASLPSEIQTGRILKQSLHDKKRVAIPKVFGSDMSFFYLDAETNISAQLERGAFGIREPAAWLEKADEHHLFPPVLIIVPGIAFDFCGNRIGHGKGYYDRFFKKLHDANILQDETVRTAGFCYNFQILPKILSEPHDLAVANLISDAGVFGCMRKI